MDVKLMMMMMMNSWMNMEINFSFSILCSHHWTLPNTKFFASKFSDLKSKFASLKCDFRDDIIDKISYIVSEPIVDVTICDDRVVYCMTQGKLIIKYQLPLEQPKKVNIGNPISHYLFLLACSSSIDIESN